MIITWYGQSCFKIQTRNSGEEVVIFIDPFDKSIGLRPPFGQGDMVLTTHDHPAHNNIKTIKGDPFVIDGPGEYEKKGIEIYGISAFHDSKEGKEKGIVSIFLIKSEDMRVCHLGDLGQKELTDEQLERIGEVDILMVPVGGGSTLSGEQASKIINQIEPKIVVPMHYKVPGLSIKIDGIDGFLKAMGESKIDPQEKITIKKKELPNDDETTVIVMKPVSSAE
jgi:L-ascorbate metabolism protein UlaG (beta-lactamase superfamily)